MDMNWCTTFFGTRCI